MNILTLESDAHMPATPDYLAIVNNGLWLARNGMRCCNDMSAMTIVLLWKDCTVIQCCHCREIRQFQFRPGKDGSDFGEGSALLSYPISRDECATIPGFPVAGLL
jgi:hypothetical protein